MIMYHGTTTKAAKEIMREGFKPNRVAAFQLEDAATGSRLRDKAIEKEPLVYLTNEIEVAKEFAIFRAEYERAKRGDPLYFGYNLPRIKLSPTIDAHAKPAIIEVQLDDALASQVTKDPLTLAYGYIANALYHLARYERL